MCAKNAKITVQIFGESYSLNGDCKADTLVQVANLVDTQMRSISKQSARMPLNQVAVLAALNIAEDYLRLEQDYQNMLQVLRGTKGNVVTSLSNAEKKAQSASNNVLRIPEVQGKK